MVSLVDIAPEIASETVTVLGKELQVWGIPNRVLAQLMRRFPELRKQMVGMKIPDDEMLVSNIEMMPAIIAAGVGALGDADVEAAADRFPSEVQADLVKTIMRLTMPAGATGPLAGAAVAAPPSKDDQPGEAPDTKSPQELPS